MKAVMISMEGREDSAEATAQQFRDIGVPVEIFVQPRDWPVGGHGNNRNSARALESVLDDEAPVLFLEDDLTINPERTKRALAAAQDVNEITYLYMHDVPKRMASCYPDEEWLGRLRKAIQYRPDQLEIIKDEVHPDEGLRLVNRPTERMFGSQCIFIPHCYKKFLLDEMSFVVQYTKKINSTQSRPMDRAVNDFRENHNLPSYVYLPHPVQHLQNRQNRSGRRMDVYSHSFDLISAQEAG